MTMKNLTLRPLIILALTTSAFLRAQQTGQLAAPPPPPPTDIAGFDNGAEPDEPGRPVARLSVASGDVSVKRGDHAEWVGGALNAPVMEADAISVSRQAAAEIQFDHAHYARMAGDTEIRVVQIDGGLHRVQLSKGLLTWRVLRETAVPGEISTPLLAVRPVGLAAVRVEVAPDTTTRVTVRHGEVEIQTARGAETLREGSMMIVRPARGESEYQITSAAGLDRWDTWSDQRDSYLLRAASPKYVSSDIYGAEDLDPYGRWSNDPAYGDVWIPNVPATWAPYRDGRWVWEDYYGWTWVDSQPWGWAPFHYGNWYYRASYGWSWFPGRRSDRYFWRPAMVGFFGYGGGYGGGFGVGIGLGNVGWVALAPYERYRPWYGRGGFGGGRNMVVNNINITNVYRNSRFGNGATGVSSRDFERGNYRNRVAVDPNHLQQASLVRGAGMTPTNDHLRFSDRNGVGMGPRTDFGNRQFFGDNRAGNRGDNRGGGTQPAGRTPFSEQQTVVRGNLNNGGIRQGEVRQGEVRQGDGVQGGFRQGGNTQSGDFRGFGGGGRRATDQGNGGMRNEQPGTRPNPAQTGGEVSPGWRQFGVPRQEGRRAGSPDSVRPESLAAGPQNPAAGRRFGGDSGSIGIDQPVVRQRQDPEAGRRFGGGFGNPAPQQRQAPERSAQRESGGGVRNAGPEQRGGNTGGGGQSGGGQRGEAGGNRRGR